MIVGHWKGFDIHVKKNARTGWFNGRLGPLFIVIWRTYK